jgi:CHAT domain-containing protein
VVLSACETGLHDILHMPEEFIGLPGAFMTVGAAAVVGTLWRVDDEAAAFLTARFYDFHLADGLPPASALRQAQLWLRDATRTQITAYRQARLDAAQICQLEPAFAGAAAVERFIGTADTPGDDQHPGERPFSHPVTPRRSIARQR